MPAARLIPPQSFVFTVICPKNEEIAVEFFAVPRFAAEHIGEIRIDWGDGQTTTPDVIMSAENVADMLSGDDVTASRECTHRYSEDGKRTVTITTPSGFLPLKRLPVQTVAVSSALPTLTVGETDPEGRPEATDTLPPLFAPDPKTGEIALNYLCADFLTNNPGLAFFDEAFAGIALENIPASLFAPCKTLKSLVRTFAGSRITAIPFGLLRHAQTLSLCEETFAGCTHLESVENPFGDKKNLPVCMEGFLADADPRFFAWCDKGRREEAGWIRPLAVITDPSFEFEWHAVSTQPETVVAFYPIDLELKGDLLIEWGDGSTERVDWNKTDVLVHAWAAPGLYRVRLHYTAREEVRPFQLGMHLTSIRTPLPIFHPRTVESLGDFCGWAADRRELAALPEKLFAANPDILNLEQAFAGCVKLHAVPDNLLEGLERLQCADGMFAFCKSLAALPASYRSCPHDARLDHFAAVPAIHEDAAGGAA